MTTSKPVQVIVTFLEETETEVKESTMSHFQASLEKNHRLGELLAK